MSSMLTLSCLPLALTPFYSPSKIASNGFWTSAETKLVSSFGYSYPELANLSSNDPRAELLAVISNLYGKEVAETQAAKVAALRANSTISPVLDAAATVASEAVASDSADSKVAPAAEAVAEISSNAAAFPHPTWWETRNPMIVLGKKGVFFGGGETCDDMAGLTATSRRRPCCSILCCN